MDKRNAMANQLLMRGWATVDQLLQASFGHWPPRGLEIVHSNPQQVQLTDSLSTFKPKTGILERLRDYLMVGGYARICGQRQIFINRLMYPLGGFQQTLGHEAAHILQGDHYWRARDIMGKDGLSELMPQQEATADRLIANATHGHFKKGGLRDVFNKVADITGFGLSYLKSGIEIQARLHEALMQGYPHWQRLPQNHQEFYFAMQSLGFALTPALRDYMNADPQKEQMQKLFPRVGTGLSPLRHSFVADIAKVEKNLTAKGLTQFWQMGMPGLYCDLIEMYGDKQGRARFGYGVNETHQFRQRHQEDLAAIRAISWGVARSDNVGRYAYARVDHIPAAQLKTLRAALDNQYIGAYVPPQPDGSSWLYVTGARSLHYLREITETAAEMTTKAAAQPYAVAATAPTLRL